VFHLNSQVAKRRCLAFFIGERRLEGMRKRKKTNWEKKFILVGFTIFGVLLILCAGAQANSPATVDISAGGIVITPLAIDNFEAMNVRIMSPDGELVVDTQSTGDSVIWSPAAGDPDGRYNWEAIVITYNPDADTGQEDGPTGEGLIPLRGRFEVLGGSIVVPPTPPPGSQQQSLWQSIGKAALRLAQTVMDMVVPSAYAADLVSEDTQPEVLFDDTQDEDFTPTWDWRIVTEGGTSNSDTDNWFAIQGYRETTFGIVEIVRIEHDGDNSASSPINALVIDDIGDIFLADETFVFDKSTARVGIGTNTAGYNIDIHDSVPEIELYDETDSTYAHIQYNSGYLTFEGNTQQDIFEIDATAPPNALIIDENGYIGFGTNIPAEAVDVLREGGAARFQLTSVTSTPTEAPQFVQRRARSGPSAVQKWDNLGLISFRGHTGSNYTGSRAVITALASQNWTSGANGTELFFRTTPNNSTSSNTVLRITNDGRVMVNGTELNVPDYVFEDNYKLMPLDDLRDYIKEKKHLPNVADVDEITSEGLDLGGSQMVLLEKVEELTLYTLQQHEQLKGQQEQIKRQQAELFKKDYFIKTLEKRIAMLEEGKDNRIASLEKKIEMLIAALGVASE
jgi:hypothetical protein